MCWATYTLLRGWRVGILNSLRATGRRGARRCTNVAGGGIGVCMSGQAQATSRRRRRRLAGLYTLPSGVGKPAIVVVRNKGPPGIFIFLTQVIILGSI
jgi:hypothetical protein